MIIIDKTLEFINVIITIVTCKIFYITFFTWFLAQTIKVLLYLLFKHKFDFRLFVGTGGMPSSHTAAVTAGTVTIGMATSWTSPVFMASLLYCIVVVSDAVGVRRAAGKQAMVLNKIIDELEHSEFKTERLKEFLGHTPFEAFVGIVIGILVPVLMY